MIIIKPLRVTVMPPAETFTLLLADISTPSTNRVHRAMFPASVQPERFSAFFANPSGLQALVSAYMEDPEGFDAAFADPSGLEALVARYRKDPAGFIEDFDGPQELLALVAAYAEVKKGASTASLKPTVTASVKLSDIDEATLKTWRATNGPKVKLTTKVGLKASVSLGEDWQSKLKEKYDAGLLAVYGADGMPLPVTPDVLTASLK